MLRIEPAACHHDKSKREAACEQVIKLKWAAFIGTATSLRDASLNRHNMGKMR